MAEASLTTRAEQTRAAIIEAALSLFREAGYEATTMRAIARRAGVSTGNAYYYFGSKEELIQEFYARNTAEHAAASRAVLDTERAFPARLRGTLCRRAGYRSDEVDVHLPQRQLASFAQQHDLPIIDLLPHFGRTQQSTFTSTGCQWNDLGNCRAAEAVGAWLRQQCATRVARK